MKPAKLFILLPALNESQNIAPLFEKIVSLKLENYEVILVDDGCTDDTAAQAESFKNRLDLSIEKHPKNLGLGPALRTGLKKILPIATPQDYLVVMDADNTQPPELIKEMLKKIQKNCDVVIASRYAPGGAEFGLASYRKFLSFLCSAVMKLFFPIRNVCDYTCAYRLMRISLLQQLAQRTGNNFFKEDGFVCMSEFLLNLHQCGAKFDETPLILHYDLKKGRSKMNIRQTILGYLRLILRTKIRPIGLV